MNKNLSYKTKIIVLYIILVLGITLIGCTGSEGPAGQDAVGVDTEPPIVRITYPLPGDTVSDTLSVSALALDNVGISRTGFFIDGQDRFDSLSFWVDEAPYTFQFDFDEMGLSWGAHTLEARANDLAHNEGRSSPILIYYYGSRAGVGDTLHLRHYRTPPQYTENYWVVHEPQDTVYTHYNVRFAPDRKCRLIAVRVYFVDDIDNDYFEYDEPVYVKVYRSDGVYPTTLLDSILPDDGSIDSLAWNTFTVNTDSATFEKGEQFHIALNVDQPSDTTRMGIAAEAVPQYDVPIGNFSGVRFYDAEEDRFIWKTIQSVGFEGIDEGFTYEFYIEVDVLIEAEESGE
ncbi:hypothetical protein K8I28_13660 [bacterium]|nr:hypothetical protein [bacterium]